jgi:outer membrane receptor protein involved in Fe transport
VTEAALFGQYTLPLADRVAATIGGRLTWSRSLGQPLDAPAGSEEPNRTDIHLSPTAALSWRVGGRTTFYARLQRGSRAGGLAVAPSGGTTSVQRFESDSLTSYEIGIRSGMPGRDRFSINAALSYARWTDIQADLVDARGLPYTANIGNGRIMGLEAEASWRVTPSLSFDASIFLNNAALSSPAPAFVTAAERDLPNIADSGGRVAAHWRAPLSSTLMLQLDGGARYVGHSQLGIGPPLDVTQGGYVSSQLGARLDFGRFALSLDIDNLTDTRGNRFSFGNPFTIGQRMQTTPLRPRTIRLGIDASF